MKESNPIQLNISNRDVGNLSSPFFWRNTKLMPPNSISIPGQYSENGRRIERAQRRIEWEHFKNQEDERWKLNWQESLINTFDEWRAGDLVGRNSDEIEWLCCNRELSDNNIISSSSPIASFRYAYNLTFTNVPEEIMISSCRIRWIFYQRTVCCVWTETVTCEWMDTRGMDGFVHQSK